MNPAAKFSGLARLARRLDLEPAVRPALEDIGDHIAGQAGAELQAQGLEHLVGSLKVSVSGTRVEVGSEHPGAPAAEFGTLQQPPRAWLQPAFQAALAPVRARLRRALKDHLT